MARCDSYLFGECTWGVCQLVPWAPEGLGNAGDWVAGAAAAGFTITTEPQVGAIVVYAAGDGYSDYGHVGEVIRVYSPTSFRVREMNFIAWDTYDERDSSTYDVAGFILPPGSYVAPGGGSADSGGGYGSEAAAQAWASLAGWWNADGGGLSNFLRWLQGQIAAVRFS